jgi:processive 1,2-diacylglycerol beta-glucosyltransferase
VREQLIERGVAAHQIFVTGIPIDPAIAEPKDKATERAALNLPPMEDNQCVITLFGGGMPAQSVRKIAQGLLNSSIKGVLIIPAGRNEGLQQEIADLRRSATLDLRILGYIDYVDSLIASSDLVITKAGGLIISEVLARGVPLIVIDPILGHEEWNADYVVVSGSGVQLRMAASVPDAVTQLMERPHLLEEMRQCAHDAGRARAAHDIAERVIAAHMRNDTPDSSEKL